MNPCPVCGQPLPQCPVCHNGVKPRPGRRDREIDRHDDKIGNQCKGEGLPYHTTITLIAHQ